jgi:predicted HicB family RNase H-like nuclease
MTSNSKQRVTIFIDPSVAKQAKAQAIDEGLSLTNLVEKALTKYLPKETIIKRSAVIMKND